MIVSFLRNTVIGIVVVAVPVIDGVSIGIAHISGADGASAAAREAVDSYRSAQSVDIAFRLASEQAARSGDTLDVNRFLIDDDGTVRLTATRTARTMVVGRIGPLKKYAQIESAVVVEPLEKRN